jgi:adenylate kinase
MYKFVHLIFLVFTISLVAFEPVIILSGPPGSGKGTFSQYLKQEYNYNHISAGDLIRNEILERTPIGLEVEQIVKSGDYISTEIMHGLMRSKITKLIGTGKPLIIDGFVRNNRDGSFLDQILSELGLVDRTVEIILESDDGLCQERIANRWICPECSHVCNTQFDCVVDVCYLCHVPLIRRINDTPNLIVKRLRDYREKIEKNQMHKIRNYPYLIFSSDLPLIKCLENYSDLADQIKKFNGGSGCFVKAFKKNRD